MTAVAVRVALFGLALLATAWFAVGIRQAQETERASAVIGSGARLSAAQARKASTLLDSAGFLNPDRQVDVLRAELRAGEGQLRQARSILKRVVASEPDNLQAWLALARFSVGDLRDFYAAAFAVRGLVPPVPRPR